MLVLAESLFIASSAAGSACWLAWLFVQGGDPDRRDAADLRAADPRRRASASGLMVLMGLLAGAHAGRGAMRLRITDALRRN